MADYGALTYCRVVGLFNTIIGDTTGVFGDPGSTPDIYNVNMPATLKVWVLGTNRDTVPEFRITGATPPRTILLAPIAARIESGVLRLPGADEGVNGVDVVAKSDVLVLDDDHPLLLTVDFGDAVISGNTYRFDSITTELPIIQPADYTAGRVQKVTLTGGGTGGQWALVYGTAPTAFLNVTATAVQLQTALRNIPAIGNNIDVTGPVATPDGPQYTLTFTGPMAAINPYIFGKIDNMVGGSNPSVRVEDTYEPVVIDLTTCDRIDLPPSTPPETVMRRLPSTYTIDNVAHTMTWFDEVGAAMGAPIPLPTGGGGSGDMAKAVYDPTNINGSPFARANHTGTQPSTTISDFTEAAQDAVAAMLAQGTGVTLTYNDAANSLTIAATGSGSVDAEAIRDAIGVALIGSGVISVTVNDAADTITISSVATQNATDAALRDRSTHTGTQSADTITDGAVNKAYTAAEKTKLGGIATGATANASDSALRDRTTHTGTQTSATISDFTEAAQDAVAAMLAGASGVTLSYNDAANTLTITGPGTGGDPESIRDTIGLALIGAGLISVTVNDAADTITITTTATANSTDAALRDRSTHTGLQTAATISDFNTATDARIAASGLLKSLFDAKGDLLVGTADNTVARLPVGSTGQALTVDPTTATGLKWATPGAGGSAIPPVITLAGDGINTDLPINHGMGTRHVKGWAYRNGSPWDNLLELKLERPTIDDVIVKNDVIWGVDEYIVFIEYVAQSDAVAPNPGTLTFSSSTSSSLTYTFTGQTDNVAVARIDAHDASSGAVVATNIAASPWTRTGLSGGTSYGTFLRVYDAEGNHADTSTVTHSTDAPTGDTTPPTAGILSFVSATSTQIDYTFTAGTDDVAVVGVDAYDAVTNSLIAPNITSPWSRTGLTPTTAYQTKLRYRDAAGNFADSNTDTHSTSSASGPVTPVASSTGTRVTSGTSVTDSVATPTTTTKLLGLAWVSLSHSNNNGTPDTYDTIEILDSGGANWTFVKGYTGGQFTASQFGTILLFKKTNMGASATHNLTCNVIKSGFTWTSMQIDTEVYDNAEDIGTPVVAHGTTGVITIDVTVAANNYAAMGSVSSGAIAGGSFASGANVRYNAGGSVTGTGDYMGVLDKAGPGSPVTLNSTGSQAWGAIAVEVQKVA